MTGNSILKEEDMSSRTVEDGLAEFTLIKGAGREAEHEACAMTLLAWVAGEEWTDHPECAHRLIANMVIQANDHGSATAGSRRQLVLAGQGGVLDTWWIPDEVIAACMVLQEGDSKEIQARALRLLERVGEWKQDKQHADLRGAVLSGADLSGADLRGAVLSGAVLSGAVLSGAVLSGADLRGAVLSGAVLRDAVLSGAVLRDADLRGAVLSGADLRGAVLSGAVGTPWKGMPAGWKLSDSGLWTPEPGADK